MTSKARVLFRPVGLKEGELILQAQSKAFPPRLPEQPIFYCPVWPKAGKEPMG